MDINEVFALFNNLGYFGIFIISFLGSIIVFVPVPYFPILITSALDKHLDPNIISISSATGAVTAKMIIFYARLLWPQGFERQYQEENATSTKAFKQIRLAWCIYCCL